MPASVSKSTRCDPGETVFDALNRLKQQEGFPANARVYAERIGRPFPKIPEGLGRQIGTITVRPNEAFPVYVPAE